MGRLLVVLVGLCAVAGCGRGPAGWTADLTWGSQVRAAAEGQTGPLAVAASSAAVVVADSFGHGLWVWSYQGGAWTGPRRRAVPTSSPLVAVTLTGSTAETADAAGTVWSVPAKGQAQILGRFPSEPGELRSVLALGSLGSSLVAEILDVRAQGSSRELVALGPGERRVLQRVLLASPAGQAPAGASWLLAPAGVRAGMAGGPGGALWLVGRRRNGRPALVRLDSAGSVAAFRAWPSLPSPSDLVGLDPSGLAWAVFSGGRREQTLVALDAAGRVRRSLPLPPGPGPLVPQPVALAPDGSAVLLTSGTEALTVHWFPPGVIWQRA